MSRHLVIEEYVGGTIEDRDAAEIHLETCARCRRKLPNEDDVTRARIRVMSQIIDEVPLQSQRAGGRGPSVALGVAAVVLLLAVPALLLARLPGPEPEVSADPAPLPGTDAPSSESFILTFEVGLSDLGWLLWRDAREWTAVRLGRDGTLRYRVGASGEGMFLDTGDDSVFSDQDVEVFDRDNPISDSGPLDLGPRALWLLARDAEIPWAQLVGIDPEVDQWNNLTNGAEMVGVVALNPLADSAAASGSRVAEFNGAGRLVAWENYRASAYEARAVTELEMQGFVPSVFVPYAQVLAEKSDAAVSGAFDDFLITKEEYENGAQLAVECALAAGGPASFSLPTLQGPGVIDLGGHTECGDLFFTPLDELWRLQVQTGGVTALERIEAILDGSEVRLAMIDSMTEARVNVASGPGWDIDVARRGPGWCIYEKQGSSNSAFCGIPDEWMLPNLLAPNLAVFVDESEQFTGVTSDDVRTVVARFSDGSEVVVDTLNESELPIRGFGFTYEFDDVGIPRTIDLLDAGGGLIATYDLYADVCEGDRAGGGMCGD